MPRFTHSIETCEQGGNTPVRMNIISSQNWMQLENLEPRRGQVSSNSFLFCIYFPSDTWDQAGLTAGWVPVWHGSHGLYGQDPRHSVADDLYPGLELVDGGLHIPLCPVVTMWPRPGG